MQFSWAHLLQSMNNYLKISTRAALMLALMGSALGHLTAREQWHVYDVLGNTVASVNTDAVVAEIESTAFGESRTPTAGARFTGKPYDSDMGAHVFPFRNYRSDAGRWTSMDPSGFPDGINNNLYASIAFSEVDPLGLAVLVAQPSLPSPDSWQSIGRVTDTRFLGLNDYLIPMFETNTYDVETRVIYTAWMSAGGQTSNPGANTSFNLNLELSNSASATLTIGSSDVASGSYSTSASVTSGGGREFSYVNPTAGSETPLSIVHNAYYTKIGIEYKYKLVNVLNAQWSAVQTSTFVGYLPHWGEQVVE
jgi:RHS repeat-associated protein